MNQLFKFFKLESLKGYRTIISGILIVLIGAIIEYQQKCNADPSWLDICTKLIVPGWVVSALGAAVVWFRKLASK